MRNATAQYLDDDLAPDASRDDEIAAEVEVHERATTKLITARDVRRTLAGLPGVEFVDGVGVIRSREEDR